MRCALVQQILGLAEDDLCEVQSAACDACSRLEAPSSARPNAVVSSLVYNLARRLRRGGGRFDCNVGQAWQAECYVRPTLAEEASPPAPAPRPRVSPWRKWWPARFQPVRTARRSRPPVIGLMGYDAASGLGYLNRDLAEHAAVDSWLMVDHPYLPSLEAPGGNVPTVRLRRGADQRSVRRWLRAVDWVVWAEQSPLHWVPHLARQVGTRVACIPMWEWTSPTDSWLRSVDLMICPTSHAYRLFRRWKQKFGFDWRVVHLPWPVPIKRFPFHLRKRCERILYINGQTGAWARPLDGDQRIGPRKGLDTVLAAAALTPHIPWKICTQADLPSMPPRNVVVTKGPRDRADLYADGDVCVQPSRWEGIGLPLLECQASGMPLITIDAAPMNEYRPLSRVAPTHWQWGYLTEGQPMRIPELSPHALADAVRAVYGRNIQDASLSARQWIQQERSWERSVPQWRAMFENQEKAG